MNKLLLLFLSATLLLSSCKKDDKYIFSQTPDERINAALAKYQALLTGAENGWKASIKNNIGASYGFYFKFTNDNRVKMLSDFSAASALNIQDAGYRFREQQQPTLIFDTYSYLHILADPNEANAGVFADINTSRSAISNTWYYSDNDLPTPDLSKGLSTDFEFIVDEDLIKEDTIRMIGKVNGSELTFIRASKTEADAFTSGGWNAMLQGYLSKEFLTYFDRLNIGGNLFDVHSYSDTTLTFSWLDGTNTTQTKTVSFTTTLLNNGLTHGVALSEPISNGTISFDSISISAWNSTTRQLDIVANGNAGKFNETIKPLKIDAGAPARWIRYATDNDGYWSSWDGFYVNGQRDAFGNNKAGINTRYYQLSYFPAAYLGSQYNILAPIFLTADFSGLSLDYYSEISFSNSAGIAKFRLRDNQTPATPPGGLTQTQLLIPEGYYFVQVSETQYDMVSAKDGKTWISWFF